MAASANADLSYGVLGGNRDAMRRVRAALAANGGRVAETARALGVSERTLWRWLDRWPTLDSLQKRLREQRT